MELTSATEILGRSVKTMRGLKDRRWRAAMALVIALLTCWRGVSGAAAASETLSSPAKRITHVRPELKFSSAPADLEFLYTGLFAEPLAPVAATTAQENTELAKAVLAYRDAIRGAGATDAVASLLTFLEKHPNSPWKPALQLNLGLIYRSTGHFSQALEVWQTAWDDAKGLNDGKVLALANAIVARLSQLEAYLGRQELLTPLLASLQDRPIGGTATQLIADSHEGLYDMVYHPEESFRCGPMALMRILQHSGREPSPLAMRVLQYESPSTYHGLSLTSVKAIAERAGMHYQAAFRTPGAPVLMPAVANWKVGHYAAIVDRGSDGRYLVQDTTFGEDIRMSEQTLDEESSGYFLVPEGPLPKGWRSVSAEEGNVVWGRGNTGNSHDGLATGSSTCGSDGQNGCGGGSNQADNNTGCPGGCTTSTVELSVVGLQLSDTPVGYKPPVGPAVRFKVVYSHRDTTQPASFSYSNFGSKWTFNWLSYVSTNNSMSPTTNVTLYSRGGGGETFTFSGTGALTSYPGPYSKAILTRTLNGGMTAVTSFTLTHPDGSSEDYGLANSGSTQFFMTAVSDPAGNMVTLTYDNNMRITAITDAIGQVSTLSYSYSGSSNAVTAITDPFGRSATFTYVTNSGVTQLTSITDVLGITSSYTYGQALAGGGTDMSFINTLTTPYGSTHYLYTDSTTNAALGSTRSLTTTDPLGRVSYVEFDQGVDGGDSSGGVMINSNLIPTGMFTCNKYLQFRNTFVFDANQYALATANGSLNYSMGRVIHWLHLTSPGTATSRVKESEKLPLENRVWYNYWGQTAAGCSGVIYFPVTVGGVVKNGASNNPTAIGRVLDSGATQLQAYLYNANGNLTNYTDPVGRSWHFIYNANNIDLQTINNITTGSAQLVESRTVNPSLHLPTSITGTNGQTAHLQYNAVGELTRYTDQLGHATTLKYDSSGHLKTVQGAISSATYAFTYDAESRIKSMMDPAGGKTAYSYDAADRLTSTTYPDGTLSRLTYTLLDLTSSRDRLGQTTHFVYDADRELLSVTDPANNTTMLGYNFAGKVNSITDPNNHSTTFVLDDQSRVSAKQLADGTSISIAYYQALSLPAIVTDALNQTKTYTYNTDSSLSTVSYGSTQPTASVSFVYDPIYPRVTAMTDGIGTTTYNYYPVTSSPTLGANLIASVNSPVAGSSTTDTVAYTYDALNRVASYSINGGTPQATSFDALGRVASVTNPLDTFNYGYSDGTSRVTSITSSSGPNTSLTYVPPQMTGGEQLQQVTFAPNVGMTNLAQFTYTYNADQLVTSLATALTTTDYFYDAANRLTSAVPGTGTSNSYQYDYASNLTAITSGSSTQPYSYTSTNEITSESYDANGSPTVVGSVTYKWDGDNRLVRYTNPSTNTSSSFVYDGLSRLVRVVDANTQTGTITADHSYLWCGANRCLAHDNLMGGAVSTQYFAQGEILSGTGYYYVTDQLGSIQQLVSASGTIVTQYAYDPYGNQSTVVGGTVASDFGYAGYFNHAASGLNFTLYRAYDPVHARWLNRDPIGESGGINLYVYVRGNPTSLIDPLGLCWQWGDPIPEDLFNYLVGTADAASFGIGAGVRNLFTNYGDLVETDSLAYDAGLMTGAAVQGSLGGAAALANSDVQNAGRAAILTAQMIAATGDLTGATATGSEALDALYTVGEMVTEDAIAASQQAIRVLSTLRSTTTIW